jgi:hypothetical protein
MVCQLQNVCNKLKFIGCVHRLAGVTAGAVKCLYSAVIQYQYANISESPKQETHPLYSKPVSKMYLLGPHCSTKIALANTVL